MSKNGKKQQRTMTSSDIADQISAAGYNLTRDVLSGDIYYENKSKHEYEVITDQVQRRIEDILITIRNHDMDHENILSNDMKNEKKVIKGIAELADRKEIHPIKRYLESAKELYIGCVESEFEKLVGCLECDEESEPLKKQILKAWFNNIIHSVYQEPLTDDNFVLVLAGPQNIGKTSFFRGLMRNMPNHFYEGPPIPGDRDCERRLGFKLIWCWDELQMGMKGRLIEQAAIKAFLTKIEITTRRMYATKDTNIRRIASFCGTTNEDEFLSDPTGNRRYGVLKVLNINHELYNSINMDLFWGETMYHYWLDGEKKKKIVDIQSKANHRFVKSDYFLDFALDNFDFEPGYIISSKDVTEFGMQSIPSSLFPTPEKIAVAFRSLGAIKKPSKHPGEEPRWLNVKWKEKHRGTIWYRILKRPLESIS